MLHQFLSVWCSSKCSWLLSYWMVLHINVLGVWYLLRCLWLLSNRILYHIKVIAVYRCLWSLKNRMVHHINFVVLWCLLMCLWSLSNQLVCHINIFAVWHLSKCLWLAIANCLNSQLMYLSIGFSLTLPSLQMVLNCMCSWESSWEGPALSSCSWCAASA